MLKHAPKRGRPATGKTGAEVTVYLPFIYRTFVDQWDGDTFGEKLRNALDDLERFRPDGPTAKTRGPGGRFKKHEPSLLERATRHTLSREPSE